MRKDPVSHFMDPLLNDVKDFSELFFFFICFLNSSYKVSSFLFICYVNRSLYCLSYFTCCIVS